MPPKSSEIQLDIALASLTAFTQLMVGCNLKDALPDEVVDAGTGVCADAENGAPCGNRRLCIDQRCVAERCGDGIESRNEECDDGNRVDVGDGCSNVCTVSKCNGNAGDPETCDGGSHDDGDGCSGDCTGAVCGNGIVEPEHGEVCEGRPQVARVGAGASYSCSADCKTKEPYTCEACQNARCTQYLEELDLVGGCFDKVNPEYGADEHDPDFIQQCLDLVNCALANRCGFGEDNDIAKECYCGARPLDTCVPLGPPQDAPCLREMRAAARTDNHMEIQNRYTDLAYPVAWAYFLIECYQRECADTCVPP